MYLYCPLVYNVQVDKYTRLLPKVCFDYTKWQSFSTEKYAFARDLIPGVTGKVSRYPEFY